MTKGIKVAWTGSGIVTPVGNTVAANYAAWKSGQHGFRPITQVSTKKSVVQVAGECLHLDQMPMAKRKVRKFLNRKDLLCLVAAELALQDANNPQTHYAPERLGVYVGACSTQIGDLTPYFTSVLSCVTEDLKSLDMRRFGSEVTQLINPFHAVKGLMNGGLSHISQIFNLRGDNCNYLDYEVSGLRRLRMPSSRFVGAPWTARS